MGSRSHEASSSDELPRRSASCGRCSNGPGSGAQQLELIKVKLHRWSVTDLSEASYFASSICVQFRLKTICMMRSPNFSLTCGCLVSLKWEQQSISCSLTDGRALLCREPESPAEHQWKMRIRRRVLAVEKGKELGSRGRSRRGEE
uniref:Uncharacterized protein n=1 Tax=Triticum urartu TaxID=4572 RepID=A0A8R7QRL9_TRIUA